MVCSVSRRSSGFTSRAFGLGLSDLFGVRAARISFCHAPCSHHLFALDEIPAGETNNCSVPLAAGCESELLFVPDPAGKLGRLVFRTSDFTIVRYLGAARCCRSASSTACFPSRRQNELLFVIGPATRSYEPNKKTHANAWVLLRQMVWSSCLSFSLAPIHY